MNKQILTDIVNSILGLSKKKKKEFIELLDDGINKIESPDFDEDDSSKHSFIKNKPFYDYDIPIDTLEFISEDFDINTSGQSVYAYENKGLGFYVKDRNNIQLVVKSYQSGSSYTKRFLDTRYKLSGTVDYISGQKCFSTIVNYYNNVPLTLKFKTFAINNNTNVEYDYTNVTVYCRYNSETEKFEFATRYLRNNSYSVILEGSVRTPYEDGYIYDISGIIYNLEYYKGKKEIENHFKAIDEKYFPLSSQSDFDENDKEKISFIKNRPFYDYEEYQGEEDLKRITYEKNYRWSTLSHLFSNKEFCIYCEGDFSNIKLAYRTHEGYLNYFIYDNTRYKIDFNNSVIMADKTVYPVINYFSNIKVKYCGEHFADASGRTKEYYLYAYFDGDINFENLKFGSEISTYGNGDKIFEVSSGITYNSGNYFGKIHVIPVFYDDLTYLEYYESPELVHIFKQLDKKFIPDITFDTSLEDLNFSTNQASNKNLVGIQTLYYATGTDLKRLYVCRGAGQWYDSKYCYLGKDNVIKDSNSQQITTFNYLFVDENFSEQLILSCLIGEEEYNFNVCVTDRQGPFEYYLFIDVEKNKYFIGKQGSTYYNYITCNTLGQLKEINLTKDFVYSEIENASFIDITKVIGFKKRVNLGIKKENEDFVEKLIKNNIPDSINNRITALEQAVIALGGTLS